MEALFFLILGSIVSFLWGCAVGFCLAGAPQVCPYCEKAHSGEDHDAMLRDADPNSDPYGHWSDF